jgi:multidrug efflux pump subunit AcrA (membrane-fusion protein)
MQVKYTLPILAVAGFLFAAYTVVSSNKPIPVAPAVAPPASAPFKSFIAGSGIVEAKSRNIAIGTPLSGIVKTVAVKVGDKVKAGTPLFYLDDRDTRAELSVKQADLAKAKAGVNEALASLKDTKSLNDLAESITDRRAISSEELLRRRNALLINTTKLDSAKALVQQAEAALETTQTTLDRLTVQASVNGEVLQVNIRPGEFAQAGALATPLLVLGNMDQLHVRVDIDENDAWRFDKNSKAVAYLRGNRDFKTDLVPAYVEPYVVPKKSLTGDSTEQVDTRVLQALYSFDRNQLPVYVGQQMDVFIEAKDAASDGGSPL